jgi:hypothetical protein
LPSIWGWKVVTQLVNGVLAAHAEKVPDGELSCAGGSVGRVMVFPPPAANNEPRVIVTRYGVATLGQSDQEREAAENEERKRDRCYLAGLSLRMLTGLTVTQAREKGILSSFERLRQLRPDLIALPGANTALAALGTLLGITEGLPSMDPAADPLQILADFPLNTELVPRMLNFAVALEAATASEATTAEGMMSHTVTVRVTPGALPSGAETWLSGNPVAEVQVVGEVEGLVRLVPISSNDTTEEGDTTFPRTLHFNIDLAKPAVGATLEQALHFRTIPVSEKDLAGNSMRGEGEGGRIALSALASYAAEAGEPGIRFPVIVPNGTPPVTEEPPSVEGTATPNTPGTGNAPVEEHPATPPVDARPNPPPPDEPSPQGRRTVTPPEEPQNPASTSRWRIATIVLVAVVLIGFVYELKQLGVIHKLKDIIAQRDIKIQKLNEDVRDKTVKLNKANAEVDRLTKKYNDLKADYVLTKRKLDIARRSLDTAKRDYEYLEKKYNEAVAMNASNVNSLKELLDAANQRVSAAEGRYSLARDSATKGARDLSNAKAEIGGLRSTVTGLQGEVEGYKARAQEEERLKQVAARRTAILKEQGGVKALEAWVTTNSDGTNDGTNQFSGSVTELYIGVQFENNLLEIGAQEVTVMVVSTKEPDNSTLLGHEYTKPYALAVSDTQGRRVIRFPASGSFPPGQYEWEVTVRDEVGNQLRQTVTCTLQ